jgi:L-threonylcarbamoyladenylate synthase
MYVQLTHASEVLQAGGVVVYPTDTVYGLGADATNREAVELVRTIKGKDARAPILAMVRNGAMLEEYAVVTPLARRLVDLWLPGPLALVLEVRTPALDAITARDGTVGFRIPDHPFCGALSAAFEHPITSTSVNRSGEEQPSTVPAMLTQLEEYASKVSLVIDIGQLPTTRASTIIDARGSKPVLLREGALLFDRLLNRLS